MTWPTPIRGVTMTARSSSTIAGRTHTRAHLWTMKHVQHVRPCATELPSANSLCGVGTRRRTTTVAQLLRHARRVPLTRMVTPPCLRRVRELAPQPQIHLRPQLLQRRLPPRLLRPLPPRRRRHRALPFRRPHQHLWTVAHAKPAWRTTVCATPGQTKPFVTDTLFTLGVGNDVLLRRLRTGL